MKLVIDRNKWSRGTASSLLRDNEQNENHGKMCCLGFYCKSFGLSDEQISNVGTPCYLFLDDDKFPKEASWLRDGNTHLNSDAVVELVRLNDRADVEDREDKIKAEFAKHGVEVEFIN